jgi:hypothetical protein
VKPLLLVTMLLLATGADSAPVAAAIPGAPLPAASTTSSDPVEVWVDLAEPAATSGFERQRRRQAEQQRVAELVRRLGGEVTVRLRHARHALLVRIAPDKIGDLRRIPGVLRVRPARTLHPPELMRSAAP